MTPRRPLECPICGHERFERRQQTLVTETGQLRIRLMAWTCRLCAYSWSEPLAPPQDAWELT